MLEKNYTLQDIENVYGIFARIPDSTGTHYPVIIAGENKLFSYNKKTDLYDEVLLIQEDCDSSIVSLCYKDVAI